MPELDLDWRIRLAAFSELRRITARTGGVIRREEISAGFRFEGEQIPFANRPRGIWRPRQLAGSGAALSLTTAVVRQGATARYDEGLDGGRLIVPRSPTDRPNRDYLSERFAQFKAA